MKKKGGPWSQHTNTYGLGKIVAKLQIGGRLLKIIRIIPVINIEKKNQWTNLWYMAQNTTQISLRYVGSVMVIVDLKIKDAKKVSLKKNVAGMDIW